MKTDRYETRKRRRRVHLGEVDKIFSAVSVVTGVSREEMQNKSQKQYLADARHLFCYIAWKFTSLPLQVIGEKINRRHSSVMHSRDIAVRLKDSDQIFRSRLEKAIEKYHESRFN